MMSLKMKRLRYHQSDPICCQAECGDVGHDWFLLHSEALMRIPESL
jgi:hypothetical protein